MIVVVVTGCLGVNTTDARGDEGYQLKAGFLFRTIMWHRAYIAVRMQLHNQGICRVEPGPCGLDRIPAS
jgi:hypothetical protein